MTGAAPASTSRNGGRDAPDEKVKRQVYPRGLLAGTFNIP